MNQPERPSLTTDIEKVGIPAQQQPRPDDKFDLDRVQEDARQHAQALERGMRGATEPARAHKYVLLTIKQIDYLLILLKPYSSSIAEEVRCKLESA